MKSGTKKLVCWVLCGLISCLFTVDSSEAQTGPTITQPPSDLAILVGGTALFNVAVSGTGPFTYQWRFYGVDVPNIITTSAGTRAPGSCGRRNEIGRTH